VSRQTPDGISSYFLEREFRIVHTLFRAEP